MRKVKTAGCFAASILLLVGVIFVFGNHLVFYAVRYGLRKALSQYEISLKSVRLYHDSLALNSVQAKNKNIGFDAAEARIFFKLTDLVHGKISKITIKNSTTQARGPADQILTAISSFTSSASAKPSGFSLRLGQLELSALALDIQSDVLTLKGVLSVLIDTSANKLSSMETQISSAEIQGLSVKNIHMSFDEKNGGQLSAESIGYQKLVATAIQSPFQLGGNILRIEPIHGVTLDGNIDGQFHIQLDRDKAYELSLMLEQLSLSALISDLKFEDKMSMTGRFFGKILVRGNSFGVDSIDGTLSGLDPGGDLVILDETFLGDIASRMNQPLELVKAGLKEYHYDVGSARLLKNGSDLGLDLSLDGPKGKRQLNTVFHDAV